MLTTGERARRTTTSIHADWPLGPGSRGISAARAVSKWAMKKSGSADWKTSTLAPASASTWVTSACSSTIADGAQHVDRRVGEGHRPDPRPGPIDRQGARAAHRGISFSRDTGFSVVRISRV